MGKTWKLKYVLYLAPFIYIYIIFAMYPNFPNIETFGALYPSTAVMKTRFVTEAAG
jgi:hypothetical protein